MHFHNKLDITSCKYNKNALEHSIQKVNSTDSLVYKPMAKMCQSALNIVPKFCSEFEVRCELRCTLLSLTLVQDSCNWEQAVSMHLHYLKN